MKFAKKYSRTMHSNPWTPCAKLKQAILYIERNPGLVRSITSFPDIINSL